MIAKRAGLFPGESMSGTDVPDSTNENTCEDNRHGLFFTVCPRVVLPRSGSLKGVPPPSPKFVQARSAQCFVVASRSVGSSPKRGSGGWCCSQKKSPYGDGAVPRAASARLGLYVGSVGAV